MAVYINQPDFPVDFLRPTRAVFDNPGSGIDGGVNVTGEAISIETTGGGVITASYEELILQGPDERHEIINKLGARLNGGFRFINVPIVTDGIGPFPIIDGKRSPLVTAIPNPDGVLFEAGHPYYEATVWATFTASAALNAGVISISTTNLSRKLRHSDWFSIYHSVKGWRAYRYWDVLSQPAGNNGTYQLAISPPLRQAVPNGTRVEFARPKCVMKLARGETIPFEYEAYYQARPSIRFTEAF